MNDSDREHVAEDTDNEFPLSRRPVRPAVIIGVIVLVALVVAGGVFAATKFVRGSATATPTPTLVPGSNLLYIQTTPGWGNIYIDGQKLAHLPNPNVDQPLQLSPGVHEVTWRADPFTQQCTIIVPPVVTETNCLANEPVPVPRGPNKGLSAFLITFTAALSDLPTAQQNALIQMAQTALNALQSSATVQPGEKYADLNAPGFVATANSTLRATLRFQLDTDTNSSGMCVGDFLGYGEGCRSNGQDCHLFCAVSEPPGAKAPPDRWDVFGIMRPTWTYTTLNGQVVAQNQPDETDTFGTEYTVALYITRVGSQWHVTTSVPGNTTDFLTAGPSCEAANYTVNDSTFGTYSAVSLPGNPNQSVSWTAQYGSNLAAGCLLSAYPQSDSATPVTNPQPLAHCLYRFGVLLALDAATQHFWPNLPLADTYEQGIAQQIS